MFSMEPRFLQFNFANFVTINLMVVVLCALVVLAMRLAKGKGATASQ